MVMAAGERRANMRARRSPSASLVLGIKVTQIPYEVYFES